ncbi:hypothetical protein U1Q18_014748 [Sarracenia purpurea var. burkii]
MKKSKGSLLPGASSSPLTMGSSSMKIVRHSSSIRWLKMKPPTVCILNVVEFTRGTDVLVTEPKFLPKAIEDDARTTGDALSEELELELSARCSSQGYATPL